MLEQIKENAITLFMNAMTKLARLAKLPETEWTDADRSIDQFSFEQIMQCFKGAPKESFLTDKPIDAYIDGLLLSENIENPPQEPISEENREMAEENFSFKDILPEEAREKPVKVTLVLCPTRTNGLQLPAKYLDDTANDYYPYFRVLYSRVNDPSGNAMGMDNSRPVPYLKLFPQEFEDTSFEIEFEPGKDRKNGESDYEYLSRMLRKKYEVLQKLALAFL